MRKYSWRNNIIVDAREFALFSANYSTCAYGCAGVKGVACEWQLALSSPSRHRRIAHMRRMRFIIFLNMENKDIIVLSIYVYVCVCASECDRCSAADVT